MTSKARQLADLGGDTANLEDISSVLSSGPLSNRNLIINGAMQVAQRGTSFATTPSNSATYTLDRIRTWAYPSTDTAAVTYTQETSSLPDSFSYYLRATVATSGSKSSQTYYAIQQVIEGYNVIPTGYGSGTGKNLTLSFWVRSSLAGTYSASLSVGSVNYIKEYTIDSANTWEYKTVLFPAYSATAQSTSSGVGATIIFSLGMGSGYTGTPDTPTLNGGVAGPNDVDFIGTSGATFDITGVQLEVGSVATPFEHRSYGQELALCQRYYFNTYPTPQSSGSADSGIVAPTLNAGDRYAVNVSFPVEMRTNPTLVYYGGRSGNANTADRVSIYNNDTLRSFVTEPSSTPKMIRGYFDTNNIDNAVQFHFTADAEL